ncbi:MAG: hypothetical protein M5R40_03045 [Anaerolineae bacterium]|nr:hypothetical protein [Anaerolineae bacterium]
MPTTTLSPVKTMRSSGKCTQAVPGVGPGMLMTGISRPLRLIDSRSENEIDGGTSLRPVKLRRSAWSAASASTAFSRNAPGSARTAWCVCSCATTSALNQQLPRMRSRWWSVLMMNRTGSGVLRISCSRQSWASSGKGGVSMSTHPSPVSTAPTVTSRYLVSTKMPGLISFTSVSLPVPVRFSLQTR